MRRPEGDAVGTGGTEAVGLRPQRRTTRSVLAGVLLAWATASGALSAQDTVLRGELLQRDGQPATDVRLVVVGHPPEVVLRDGGMFAHALTGAPAEVSVRVVGAPGTEVLYPPDGRVVVPRDANAVVAIVVGERIGAAVEERIGRDLAALRETLEVRGVSEADIQAVVRDELDGLVTRIADLTEGAVERAVAGADRAELRDRVSRYLNNYLRTATDLRDAFAIIDVSRDLSQSEFLTLYNAMAAYSDAYAELDRETGETPTAVRSAWPGSTGQDLAARLEGLLGLIQNDLHQTVLTLRQPLVVIQGQHTNARPSRDDLRAAKQAVVEALPRIAGPVDRLDRDLPTLLEALRSSS